MRSTPFRKVGRNLRPRPSLLEVKGQAVVFEPRFQGNELLPATGRPGIGTGEGKWAIGIFLQLLECLADRVDTNIQGLGEFRVGGAGLPSTATGAGDRIEVGFEADVQGRRLRSAQLPAGWGIECGLERSGPADKLFQLGAAAFEFLEGELAAIEIVAASEDPPLGGSFEPVDLGRPPTDLRIDLVDQDLAFLPRLARPLGSPDLCVRRREQLRLVPLLRIRDLQALGLRRGQSSPVLRTGPTKSADCPFWIGTIVFLRKNQFFLALRPASHKDVVNHYVFLALLRAIFSRPSGRLLCSNRY